MITKQPLYKVKGTLVLHLDSLWGIIEASAGNRMADLIVRQASRVILKNGTYDIIKSYEIEGSSLRGTLRASAIKLLQDDDPSCKSTNPKDMCVNPSCMICTLFGGPNHEGKLRISQGTLVNPPEITVTPHVSINRKTRTANATSLFFEERLGKNSILVDLEAQPLTTRELEFLKTILSIWGDHGLGKKHVSFEIEGINDLIITELSEEETS